MHSFKLRSFSVPRLNVSPKSYQRTLPRRDKSGGLISRNNRLLDSISMDDERAPLCGGIPPPAAPPAKWSRGQWTTLAALAFGNFCAGACVSLQAPFFPAEAERKGATATEYGLIFGVFQLTIFVASPVIGKLVPYFSPKHLLNVGVLTVGLTCILFGTLDLVGDSRTFVALAFVVRTAEGLGAAALKTAGYVIVASHFPDGIGKIFAVLETFLGVGLITGPTLGGALYDAGGYGLPFYAVGGLVLVDALVIALVLPPAGARGGKQEGLLRFWLHPTTLMYALSVFTCFNYIGFNQATLEPHLRQFSLSGVLLGLMFGLGGTAYALSAPAFGWIADKKCCRSEWLSLVGCACFSLSVLLIGPAPFLPMRTDVRVVVCALALMGLSFGAKLVSAFTGMIDSTARRGLAADLSTFGLVSSMIASSQSLGAFAGPSLGGLLVDSVGYAVASSALLLLEGPLVVSLVASLVKGSCEEPPDDGRTTPKSSC